jgi:carboxyl-terminal processing protease
MRTFPMIVLAAACSLVLSLSSCQSPQPTGGTTANNSTVQPQLVGWFTNGAISGLNSNTTAADLDIKDFLAVGMQDIYYWRDRVPTTLVGSSFPTPDSLLIFAIARPEDRFSAIIQDGIGYYNRLINAQQPAGFGAGYTYISSTGEARLSRVSVPSPAWQAGLRRGMKVLTIDGKAIPATFDAFAQQVNNLGTSVTLTVEDSSGVRRTVSMMATTFTEQVAPVAKVFTVGTKKVGYLLFTSYTQSAVDELSAAFANFKSQGVTDLVLDLRYNGGGSVATAAYLCGLLAPQLAGTPCAILKYNSKYAASNQQFLINSIPSALNLTRLAVITTGRTASASELTINALKPYMTVVTIGATSFGKPVGSNIIIHQKSGYMLLPISFAYTNALGQADFLNGFPATYKASDDVTRDFGDPQEASLKAALTYMDKGTVPVTLKTARSAAMDESAQYVPMRGERILPVLLPMER